MRDRQKMVDIKWAILRHLPSITIKSYCTHVFGCKCEKFIPEGDDQQSWIDWAEHVTEEIMKCGG